VVEHIIYRVTSPSGKMYIGQTVNLERRKYAHIYGYHNTLISRAIKKYGPEKIKWDILCCCDNQEEANCAEIFYIAMFNTFNGAGYNMTCGGDGAGCGDANHQYRHDVSDNEIVELRNSGETIKSISETVGLSVTQVQRRLRRLGLTQAKGGRAGKLHYGYRDLDVNKMASMRELGYSYRRIGRELGCHYLTVIKKLRESGLDK